jgi:RNA binding exosome subunit
MDLKKEVKKDWNKLLKWSKKEFVVLKKSNVKGHYLNQINSIETAIQRKDKLPNEIKSDKNLSRKDKDMLLDKLKFS